MVDFLRLDEARDQPVWRRPKTLLFVMALAMPIAFSTWYALLNNFVKEVADFDGADIGLLHTIREIPGFLSFLVIFLIIAVREQVLGLVSLMLLGAATAVTAWFPELTGIMILTFLSSVGFHYYETVNQSLQLQWLPKDRAPQILGWLLATGSATTFCVFFVIMILWEPLGLTYNGVFMAGGGITIAVALFALLAFPQYESPHPQIKRLVVRRRYWLYYALQFMSGARRQIFMVFAGFMMVEKFGFQVHEIAGLYLVNLMLNMLIAPVLGKVVARFGERNALMFEYVGLICVFLAYGGVYFFDWSFQVAAVLFVLDHLFFGLALALKTYFQKIGAPGDMAPTAAVAFTINHIAAVFLPVLLGLLWLVSPMGVFLLAAGMAAVSLMLATLIPRHPVPGAETIFAARAPQAAE
ncbi:MFS transporter [Sulfitobacter sp. S190]|uniref:MFS transporter n=1 Tax=Sulfitobacter sp. S190 TaxID=2867022 RepID=UPI0021A95654|nr:MFS transporter [Sulfitobacter sp. S190]UWR23370.1 MFS transporter [Sulfitobacter sp. S190]